MFCRYTITKYVSVVTITIGIILCTYASSEQVGMIKIATHLHKDKLNCFYEFKIWF